MLGELGLNAIVKWTSDHRDLLLPETTFIISSGAYENNGAAIL